MQHLLLTAVDHLPDKSPGWACPWLQAGLCRRHSTHSHSEAYLPHPTVGDWLHQHQGQQLRSSPHLHSQGSYAAAATALLAADAGEAVSPARSHGSQSKLQRSRSYMQPTESSERHSTHVYQHQLSLGPATSGAAASDNSPDSGTHRVLQSKRSALVPHSTLRSAINPA